MARIISRCVPQHSLFHKTSPPHAPKRPSRGNERVRILILDKGRQLRGLCRMGRRPAGVRQHPGGCIKSGAGPSAMPVIGYWIVPPGIGYSCGPGEPTTIVRHFIMIFDSRRVTQGRLNRCATPSRRFPGLPTGFPACSSISAAFYCKTGSLDARNLEMRHGRLQPRVKEHTQQAPEPWV